MRETNSFSHLTLEERRIILTGITNRPSFQRMLVKVEAGNVDTIIVKDMSRLGRNYLQVGFQKYRKRYFEKAP